MNNTMVTSVIGKEQTSEFADTLCHHGHGATQFLERPGDGPAMVFLHGIGSNSDSFRPLFDTLPEGPRLIAWNAPGYLASTPLAAEKPTAGDYASVLAQFLDALDLEAPILIGHSLGTLIAAALAVRSPGRISSLVLAASAQGYGADPELPLPSNAAKRLEELAALGPAAFAEARASRLVHDPDGNPSVVALVRREMARINPDGYAQAVHMLASGDLAATVAQLHHKPGFIIGAEDRITPVDQTDAAMKAWAEVHGAQPRCISIAEAGHAVYVQAPHAFGNALMELISDRETPMPSHAEGELHGG